MDTAAQQLLRFLTSPKSASDVVDRMRHNIDYLNSLDERFAASATSLLDTDNDEVRTQVGGTLGMYLADDRDLPAASISASDVQNIYRVSYNAAQFILDTANRVRAREEITPLLSADLLHRVGTEIRGGDEIMMSQCSSLRPDSFSTGKDEWDRYYHPLVVSAAITRPTSNDRRFITGTPAFIKWATAQDNLHDALTAALRTSSIDPNTIIAKSKMMDETATPLHSGLL